jgi:hypothetical protein
VCGAVLRAALDGEQHGDQLGAHGDEAFGVGLGRDDVQQWNQGVGRGWGVVAQRELGEFEEFLDPDAGVAQGLDDGPGPERVLFEHGDVRAAASEWDGAGSWLGVQDFGHLAEWPAGRG